MEEGVELEAVEAGLASMIDKYGIQAIADTVARMAQKS